MQATALPTSPPAWCEQYVGRGFESGGRGPRAYDCYGLVMEVYGRRRGLALPDPRAEYNDTDPSAQLAAALDGQRMRWGAVAPGALEELDVAAMRFNGFVCHVGLVVAAGWMLHVRHGANVCLERFESVVWRPRVEGFYRWRS